MSEPPHTDVFISYKRRKRPEIEHIATALRELKLTVWFDARLEPGVSFSDEIATEVRRARSVLVCWTNDCFPHGGDQNGWVRAEAAIARGRSVYVPCFLEPTDLDPPFNNDHAESLIGWATPAGLGPQDHHGWLDILTVIGRHVGRQGLADYSRAQALGDMEGLRRFAQTYPADPLADAVWAQIAEAEANAARARTEAQRKAAMAAAKPAPEAAPKAAFAQRGEWPQPAKAARPTPAPKATQEPPSARRGRLIAFAGIAGIVAFVAWAVLGATRQESSPSVAMEEAAIPAEQSDAPAVGGTPKSTPDAASLPLPDEAAWSITTKTSRDAVETFLRDYPDSPRAADARRALDQIAQDALRLARQAGTAQALRNWIVAWPGRPEIPQARIALDAANKRDLGRGLDEAREQAKLAQPKTVNQSGTVSKGGCATSQFTIYFDWDRVSLNPTAVDAIDTALARARRGNCQFAAVRVVGHTDTERSAQYAQGLSLRRADAVRDALAARGVPLALITVEGRGETELARATPDGVREPLNRRAEVSFTFR